MQLSDYGEAINGLVSNRNNVIIAFWKEIILRPQSLMGIGKKQFDGAKTWKMALK